MKRERFTLRGTGFPIGGETITRSPRWENETLHITTVYGNGDFEIYTNGVLHAAVGGLIGRMDEVGDWFSWIGRSPYFDPFVNATVDEFRIYRGRLSPAQIEEIDALGPDQLLSTGTGPELKAARIGSELVLTWPITAAGFFVQSRANLAGGSWLALTNAPMASGNNWEAHIPIGNEGAAYFRLSR